MRSSAQPALRIIARLGIVAILAGCSDAPTAPDRDRVTADLSAEWQRASPESQGFDPDRLRAAMGHARGLPRLLSVLVVRHGRLVAEEYFHGNRVDSLNDVRSVTKSIVSTLVGIAVDQGALPGVTAPIGDYLTAAGISAIDPAKGAITVEHLLTMSSGFEWDETSTSAYNEWVLSADPIDYLLSRSLVSPPGRQFRYNSAAVHLLSVVLEAATGMSTIEFARRNLFEPLGISSVRWETFPDGRANGGAGIDLRPRDLAKLGVLWLQGGDAGGRRIVQSAWIAEGTSPQFGYWGGQAPLADQSYGYLWWLNRARGTVHSFAWGYGGQLVWVAPDLDLVAVVTTEWRNAGPQADMLARQGQDLIVNHVIPAVR